MKSIRRNNGVVAVLIGLAGALAHGAPVQWKVSDGGNDHWYEAVKVPGGISWEQANAAAQAAGWHLATITSEAENDFVYELVAHDSSYWALYPPDSWWWGPWLGGFQPPGSGEPKADWQWVTGEAWTYENWHPGEPDDDYPLGQDGLQFLGNGQPGPMWNDDYQGDPIIVSYIMEVPEPATMSLYVLGGLVLMRRRRSAR